MTTTHNQIHLKGEFQREEGIAAAAISPGMVVEETSATAQTYQAQSSAKAVAERLIAVEDALQGNTKDDDYAAGDIVSVNVELPGNRVQVLLAAGESVTKAGFLELDGNGMLQAFTNGEKFAVAKETLDLSASGAVATLLDVAIL